MYLYITVAAAAGTQAGPAAPETPGILSAHRAHRDSLAEKPLEEKLQADLEGGVF